MARSCRAKESQDDDADGGDGVNGDDGEEEDEYKWWENMDEDDTIKWHTLQHSGVLFPPGYIPHKVPLVYDNTPVVLPPDAEEVATFFAALVDTDWGRNLVFQKNFFRDFQAVLKDTEKAGHRVRPGLVQASRRGAHATTILTVALARRPEHALEPCMTRCSGLTSRTLASATFRK